MKNKTLKFALGLFSIISLIMFALPHFAAAVPLVHLLPHWAVGAMHASAGVSLNQLFTPAVGGSPSGVALAPPPPTWQLSGTQSIARAVAPSPKVASGVSYGSQGQVKPLIHLRQELGLPLSMNVTYTITQSTYVANTTVPFVPRSTTDNVPTGVTFSSPNFSSQLNMSAFFAGLKKIWFQNFWFAASNDVLFGTTFIGALRFNDLNVATAQQFTMIKQVATILPDEFDKNTRIWPNANVTTWEANNQTVFSCSAIPDATDTLTISYYPSDSVQGGDYAPVVTQ